MKITKIATIFSFEDMYGISGPRTTQKNIRVKTKDQINFSINSSPFRFWCKNLRTESVVTSNKQMTLGESMKHISK